MKRLKKSLAVALAFLLCLSFAGCSGEGKNTDAAQDQQVQEENSAEIENQINQLLSETPACEGWAPSIAEMVNTVFHNYQWSFEPYAHNEEVYVVEISGSYSPNPDLPNLSQEGTIRYFVNPETGEVKLYTDPDGISSVFMIYIVN